VKSEHNLFKALLMKIVFSLSFIVLNSGTLYALQMPSGLTPVRTLRTEIPLG
jgi:hypothetical protein